MKKNWLTVILTATISIIGSLLIMGITFKRDDKLNVNRLIDSKIDRTEAIEYIDKGDNSIKYELTQHELADSKRLESMDKKLDIIISQMIR